MKNIALILLTLLTLAGCSDKRESDISPNFNPGQTIPAGSLSALPSQQTTPENTPYSSTVPANINNQLPAPVYSLVNQPVHGTVNLNSSTGSYTYTPYVNYSGPDLFTWQVAQGPQISQSSVNINVVPTNLPPVANPVNVTVVEDTPLVGTLTGSDPNGDLLTCSAAVLPSHGTLIVNPNCTYTYTPAPNYFGPDSFTFQVSDGPLTSPPATVSINVTPVNDAPVAGGSSFSTPEDTARTGVLSGTDVEGSTLTYAVGTSPTHGTLVINSATGSYTYTPAPNYNGPDSFTFTVNDGLLTSVPATVAITVTSVNDAPIALTQSFATPEDTLYSGVLNGVDADGDNLTYILTSSPTKGLVTIQNVNLGTFTYQPYLNQTGTDSFTFKVNDGSLDSPSVTVFVNITPVNDAPVSLNSSFSLLAGSTHNGMVTATDVDSPLLTYLLVGSPTKGTLTFNPNGTYTYVANTLATGADSFTFKANDSLLNSNVAIVTINIGAAVNQPPVAQNATLTIPEDSVGSGTLVATDPESAPLTYSVVTPPTHGSLLVNPNGTYTYTPAPNYFGPDYFTFKANDGVNDSNTGTISLNVTPVNDLPVATNANYTISENQTLSFTLVASDVDGDPLTYTIVTNPIHGTLTVTGSNVVFTPALNYNGPDSFTFKANDGNSDSNVATIGITVTNINQAPVANNQTLSTPEDSPLLISLLANDPDADTLTYSVVTPPLHGTLSGTGSNLTYTPAPNYNGPDSFTFKANDGSVDSNVATISLNVTPVNDTPVAANQSVTTPEETAKNITLSGSDIDGNTLIYTIITPPLHGTLSGSGVNVVYTPALNYNGTDSFTFKVNDGTTDSNTATVSVTVTPVNDAPVANNQSVTTPEDTGLNINLLANDIDGNALTYTIVTQPTHGIAILVGDDVSYIPNSNYSGPDSFTFKVNDGTVDSNVATVSITVTPVNDAPVANAQNISTPEDTAYNGTLTGMDPEASPLTYIQVTPPTNGVLVLNPNGTFTYTPNSDYNGPDSFTFKANDGTTDSAPATVTINVTPVNDAPVAYNQSININEDTSVNITLTGSDPESSPLTYTVISAPLHGTLSGTAPNVVYTPAANYYGTDTFTFKVNDGTTNSNLASIFITINSVNDAPVAIPQLVTAIEDTPVNITLTGTDPDGDPLTYIIVTPPTHGTLTGSGPNIVYTPAPNYFGPDSFSFKVNDGTIDSPPATIAVNVTPVNDAPVAAAQSVTTQEDTAKNITLSGTDAEGSTLTYTILTGPNYGTLSGSGANVIYTPAANYNGPDSFTFKVNDGTTDSSPATVVITVTPINDAPIAQAQALTTPEATPLNVTLVGTDVDGDALTYTLVTPPAHGTLTGTGVNRVYTPVANYNGPDSFNFKVNDGTVDSNIATISINVSSVNDAPVAFNQSATTPEDTVVNIPLVATDADGNTLTYIITQSPLHGSLVLVGSDVNYIPAANYFGPDEFKFKVNDGLLDSNVATVSLTVTPVNDAPLASNSLIAVGQGQTVNSNMVASDVEGSPLTYSVVASPTKGTLTFNASTGSYTYTANISSTGQDTFTFKVNDGLLNSNTATVTININAVNYPPVANNQNVTTPEDTNVSSTLTYTDPNLDTVTFAIVANPTHGTVNLNPATGVFTYIPALNYNGLDSFTYKVNDGSVDSNTATVNINVTPVNDAPLANNQNVSTPEDTLVNITLTGSDVESSPITYTIVTPPIHGTLTGTGANQVYTPSLNYNGPDSFTFKTNDGTVDSLIGTVTINVTPVNDLPVANNQSVTTSEDTALNITLTATDADGDALTYTIVTAPTHGTLSGSGANVIYAPAANYNGPDSFTFRANDGTANSNIATVSISVDAINDAPIAANQSVTTPEDTPANITLSGTDADGDSLTYIIVTPPLHGTLSGTGANVVYTPAANYFGPDTFSYKVNDGTIDSNIATISLNVSSVNDTPVANNQSVTTPEDTAANITLLATDADGDALTYTIVSAPLHGTLSGTGSNVVYNPAANYFGPDSFSFRVNDGTVNSNVATISLNVTSVNDIPLAQGQSLTTPEDTALNITLTGTDADGDTLTYAISSGPLSGTLTGTGANRVYTPALNYNGPDSFSFTVNDGTTTSAPATIAISVTPVNDTPIANNQTITTPEDAPVNVTLTANDADGDTLTYTVVTPPLNGTLTGTGANLTYTPNANYFGPDSFSFKANDGTIDSNVATIYLNVTSVNDAPIAANQSVTTPEDTAKNITLSATDADGNTLTYSIVTSPLHGTLSGSGANRVYTPALNYNGPDSFSFKANDGTVDSNIATISLNVTPINDAPIAANQSVTATEDTPLNITLTATDIDGDPLTYTIVDAPLHGTLSGSGANVVYTPNTNYNGPDSFTFKANDGTIDSNAATITLNVNNVNDAPVAANQSLTIPEDTALNITLTGTDVDGDSLSYLIVAAPLHGTLTGTGANRVYTPAANYNGPDSFTYKVNDGSLDSNVATISLNVTPVNDAPVANGQSLTLAEDSTLNITLTGSDVDGNAITYTIVTGPLHGTLSGTESNQVYTPAANYNGPDSFTFKVNDGTLDSTVATMVLTVTPVNDAPVASNQTVNTPEDTASNITLGASDIDGDTLSYTIVSAPLNGTLTGSGSNRVYTPSANYFGPDSFTFKVNDGTIDSNTATVSITVTPVNDVPVAAAQSVTTPEDTGKGITLGATDADGDTLTYTIVSAPLHGSLTGTGANVTYTPVANYNGPDSFTFKVNDGTIDSNTATVSITVTPVNDVPVAAAQSVMTPEDTAKNVILVGTDVDGDSLTYTIVASPLHGTLTGSSANRVYTPFANYNGPDSFTFKVNDGTIDSNTATVSITVTPVNDAPAASNLSVTTPEDTSILIPLIGSDIDGDLLIYSIVAQPLHGSLVLVGTDVTYIPAANYFGPDSFTYKVNDGTVDSNIATVSITVSPVNDIPLAANQSITTPEDTAKTGTLSATDADGDALVYSIVAQGTKGTVTITNTATGAFTYTPNANANGSDSFTFKANDGTANSNTATVSVTITPVNDSPIAQTQSITTPEDTAKTGTLVATDVDGDALTYSVVAQGTKGIITITNAATGAFTYTPNLNANGSDTFTFKANDGTVDSNIATVSVIITPVNDAPVSSNQTITTPEDTIKTGTLVATDVDGDSLVYSVVAQGLKGNVTITNTATGAFTYTPNANANGTDTFTFKANDGILNSNTATVTVNITPVNDAPIANNSSFTTLEDTAFNGSLTASDVDGDPLTYSVVAQGLKGVVTITNISTGAYTYTPNANANGTDSFTFKVNDGTVNSNTATVSIIITPVNDAPVAASQSITTLEDTLYTGALVGTDVDGNPLVYSVVAQGLKGFVTITNTATGAFTYTPNANANGADTFTFKVNDGTVDSNIATVSVIITPVNDAPVALTQSITTPEDIAKTGTLVATDVEGDSLTYSIVAQGNKGVVTIINAATGAFTYAPNLNANGSDSFTFRASDGTLFSNTAAVSVTITPVNDAPIATAQSITTLEDTVFTGSLIGSDVDGDALVYLVVAQGTKGTVAITNTVTGAFTYTPNANANGTDTFTFKVNDGTVDSNTATVTVNITPVNDAPIAQFQSVTTPEDTNKLINMVGTDVDGDLLSYTILTQPTNGTLVQVGADVTYIPNLNYNGPDSFTFRVNDGTVNSNTATVSITVTPVNDAPVANNTSFTTPEDTVFNGSVTATDVDGNTLTYSVVTAPTKGTITLNSNGTYTYTPSLNQNGADSFVFKANDGTLNSNNATVSITITPVNDAPIAAAQSVATPEDTAKSITLVGTDVDGDTLTYTIVAAPLHGTLTGTGANRVYTPAVDYNGSDSFTFKVNDGTIDSNTATITINVTPVNDAPVAANQTITTPEDTLKTGTLVATDVDGDSLTYSIVTQGTKGTVTITNTATGAFTYTPNLNANGTDTFTFKTNDGVLNSNIAAVTVNITPVNDAPIANNSSLTTPEDTAFNGTLTASDIDADPLVYSVVAQGTKGTVTITNTATGAYTYTPNANANGSDSFTFKVNDGTVNSNTATVSVTITPVNDSPVAANQSITTLEDTVFTGTLVGTDVDGNPLVYSVVAQGTKGTVTITNVTTGAFTYTPNANANGSDSFTFKVNDGTVDSNVATASVTIIPVNDAPIALAQSVTTAEDTNKLINLVGTDVDGDLLSYIIVSSPTNGTLVQVGADVTYIPNLNYNGPDSFTFKVNDGTVNSNTATVSITVTPVNDAPVANNSNFTTPEDTVFNGSVTATDVDGNTLTYSVVTAPTKGTLTLNTNGTYTYTPNLNANGADSFVFRANDGTLFSNNATVSINITPVNDAPIAANQLVTTPEDTAANITLSGTDVDGDTLTYTIVASPLHGTLTGTGSNRVYTPAANYFGPDSFTFKVNDGTVDSNTATVSINVTAVNDAPVAANQSISTNKNVVKTGTVTATDVEGSPLTYSVVTAPAHGTVTITASTGAFIYTPALNYSGPDSFTFKANDGATDSNVATVSITVVNTNVAPVAAAQSVSVSQNSTNNAITLVGTDADSDPLTYTIVTGPTNGTLSGSGANRLYTPNVGFAGTDTFTFKVNDGTVDSNIATVTILVNEWCDTTFAYSHKLILNNQDQTSVLSNFPVMVKLNSNRVNYTDIKANGDDLRFYDSTCNSIPYEIERWNTSGDSTVWVKVPSIDSSSNASFIWMSYGKASATAGQNKTAVWDSNYVGVYHFEEITGNALDSTSFVNNMVPNGTPVRNVQGRVAGAELFDSTSDRFAASSTPSLAMTTTSSFTLEAWVYVVSNLSNSNVIERQYSTTDGSIDYGLYVVSGTPYMRARNKSLQFNTQLPLTTWTHLSATFDSNLNTCTLYVNGVQKAQSNKCSENLYATGSQPTYIGGDQSDRYFNGGVDEPRISNTVRSPDWIRAQHLSMTDGMISYGSRRTLSQNPKQILMTVKVTNDDGYIKTSSSQLFQTGSNGINYMGSDVAAPKWAYYRFQLPATIPVGAVIKTAKLRLYGRDSSGSQYLTVHVQNAANSTQITAANQYPGGAGGVTVVGTNVSWGSPALTWLIDDWNQSPELKPAIDSLKTAQGGVLTSGNYIQVWVTKGAPVTTTTDIGSEDNTYETINHAQLTIEYE